MLTAKNRSSRPQVPIMIVALLILLAGSIAFGGYYFKQYRTLKAASSKTADQVNEELVTEISKVYELPKDEKPVFALVSDEATFKKEYPVFTSAKKGDDLLLYEKAGQAILYRPSEKKVIGTASFAVKRSSNVAIIAAVTEQSTTEKILQDKLADSIKVTSKSTPVGSYTTSQVIDVSGKQAAAAKAIADTIGATVVSSLPPSEKAPTGADIVVIVANAVAKPGAVEPTPVTTP